MGYPAPRPRPRCLARRLAGLAGAVLGAGVPVLGVLGVGGALGVPAAAAAAAPGVAPPVAQSTPTAAPPPEGADGSMRYQAAGPATSNAGSASTATRLHAARRATSLHHHEAAELLAAVGVLGVIAVLEMVLGATVLGRRRRAAAGD